MHSGENRRKWEKNERGARDDRKVSENGPNLTENGDIWRNWAGTAGCLTLSHISVADPPDWFTFGEYSLAAHEKGGGGQDVGESGGEERGEWGISGVKREWWQNGKMAKWQNGKMAKWQNGKMAKWQNGNQGGRTEH